MVLESKSKSLLMRGFKIKIKKNTAMILHHDINPFDLKSYPMLFHDQRR